MGGTMDVRRRVVAVLLQVVIPGCVGAFLTFVMAHLMSDLEPGALLPFVVFTGPIVGLLTWLFGLFADRASGERLLLTVLCATGGLLVSFLVLFFSSRWLPPRPDVGQPFGSALAIAAVGSLLAPLGGALAGYYWVGK